MLISLMFMMCQLEDSLVSSTSTCTREKANMVMLLVSAYRYDTYLVYGNLILSIFALKCVCSCMYVMSIHLICRYTKNVLSIQFLFSIYIKSLGVVIQMGLDR